MTFARLMILALLAVGTAAGAQTPAAVPPQVRARIAALDARCKAAGGQPVAQPYVFVHDYTGDGRPDFLISEGNYGCSGRPTLFRGGDDAAIEVFVTQADGSATSGWSGRVLAYRLLDRRPTAIQIAVSGAQACGAAARCGLALRWDGAAGRFVADPIAATATASAAPPEAAPAPVAAPAPMTQAAVLAACRERLLKQGVVAKNTQSICADEWARLAAAQPMAKAILALASQPPSVARTIAGAKAALAGVVWHARNDPPVAPMTVAAQGDLGKLAVSIEGRGGIDQVGFAWGDTGAVSPYDLPAALRARGVALTPIACGTGGDSFGDSTTTDFRVDAPGGTPFRLEVNQRDAADGQQQGWYTVTAFLAGPMPTLASLRARSPSTDPIEAVQWGQCR